IRRRRRRRRHGHRGGGGGRRRVVCGRAARSTARRGLVRGHGLRRLIAVLTAAGGGEQRQRDRSAHPHDAQAAQRLGAGDVALATVAGDFFREVLLDLV